MPVEYPTIAFDKLAPVQIAHEGPLRILSIYKVKSSLNHSDFLETSQKTFDAIIWTTIFICFVVFISILIMRRLTMKTLITRLLTSF